MLRIFHYLTTTTQAVYQICTEVGGFLLPILNILSCEHQSIKLEFHHISQIPTFCTLLRGIIDGVSNTS